jgi:3'-5' exoribonuclease
LKELNVGDSFDEKMVMISDLSVKVARNKTLVNNMTLQDSSGTMPAVYFGKLDTGIACGSVITIDGAVGLYNDGAQITINHMTLATGDNKKFLQSVMPASRHSKATLSKLISRQIAKIGDVELREFVLSLLEANEDFYTAPAGKRIHHDYTGGLVEHSVSVSIIALTAAQLYDNLDTDLIIAGSILHDIGKVDEMTTDGSIDYSDTGKLMGHAYLGARIVEDHARSQMIEQDRLNDLIHVILSHHGELEFGAVLTPVFPEAELIHLADRLDARTSAMQGMVKKDVGPGRWTAFDPLLKRTMRKPATAEVAAKDQEKDAVFV